MGSASNRSVQLRAHATALQGNRPTKLIVVRWVAVLCSSMYDGAIGMITRARIAGDGRYGRSQDEYGTSWISFRGGMTRLRNQRSLHVSTLNRAWSGCPVIVQSQAGSQGSEDQNPSTWMADSLQALSVSNGPQGSTSPEPGESKTQHPSTPTGASGGSSQPTLKIPDLERRRTVVMWQ
jgi:hypothetical protein